MRDHRLDGPRQFIIKLNSKRPPRSNEQVWHASMIDWERDRDNVIAQFVIDGGSRLYPDEAAGSEMSLWWTIDCWEQDLLDLERLGVIDFYYRA